MQQLMNDLNPTERALLYTAMLFFKNQSEEAFSAALLEDHPNMLKLFANFAQEQTKLLMNKLFADCFPEDLELMDHFHAQWKNQHTQATETQPAPLRIAG